MSTMKIALLSKDEVAHGTTAFHFERPQGFDFKPGQAIDLVLPVPGGEAEARHAFSLVSAPHENELVIATRMRDSVYKRALNSLEAGQLAGLEGPFGSLTLGRNSDRTAVLIAGGIGITPYMSMIRDAVHGELKRGLVLLYSNRRPEDAAFLGELLQAQTRLPQLSVIATMTRMENSSLPWKGECGVLDAARLRHLTAGLASPLYYVAGPPAMVEALRRALEEIGIADDDIRSEDFFGY